MNPERHYKLSARQKVRLNAQMALLCKVFAEHKKFTVLDLGMEYGLTGIWVHNRFPKCEVTGVEIHEPTFKAAEERAKDHYENMVLGDAMEFLKQGHCFDVVICAELIEHLPRNKGDELLSLIKAISERLAIVTSPLGFMHQDDLYGNPHQRHVSGWDLDDFNARGWRCFFSSKENHLGVYYHADKEL